LPEDEPTEEEDDDKGDIVNVEPFDEGLDAFDEPEADCSQKYR